MARDKLLRRCELWWCDDKHYANGYCEKHNAALYRYGTPISPKQPHLARLLQVIGKLRYLLIHYADTSIPSIAQILDRTEDGQRLFVSPIGDCPICKAGYRAHVAGDTLSIECDCRTREWSIADVIAQYNKP